MIGPPLYREIALKNSSCDGIRAILYNSQYGFPQISLPMVDVRDVAEAHINAIMSDKFKNVNARFLVAAKSLWFKDIIRVLKEDEKIHGKKIKTKILGRFTMTLGSVINPQLKNLLPFVDHELLIDGSLMASELGISYRDVEESLREMAL